MGQTKDSKWLKAVRFQRKPPEFLNEVTFDAIKTTFTDIFQQSCRAILQTLLAVSQIVNSHFAFTSRDFGRCHDSVCLSLCLHGFTAATPNSSHISQALSKLSTLNCLYARESLSLCGPTQSCHSQTAGEASSSPNDPECRISSDRRQTDG